MSTSMPKSAFSFPRSSAALSNRGAVVVTGASSGIGRATAVRLARSGFEVFAGVRKEEDERSVRALAGASVTPIRLDVTHPDSVAGASREVSDAVGHAGIDGLVNNAGIATV